MERQTKRECRKLGICYNCKEKLVILPSKNINTQYKNYGVCPNCNRTYTGKGLEANKQNPFFFSYKSYEKRNEKLNELNLTYKEYLSSFHWQDLRSKYLTRCVVCGKKAELHHRTYQRLGKEKETDLISLCREHHELTHIK